MTELIEHYRVLATPMRGDGKPVDLAPLATKSTANKEERSLEDDGMSTLDQLHEDQKYQALAPGIMKKWTQTAKPNEFYVPVNRNSGVIGGED
ncbi:MAG: hypothetical protein NT074_03660 [Methanomicrobiales archaeon]|nr:hypothetical protein [Methanomicrobiales archaeon]